MKWNKLSPTQSESFEWFFSVSKVNYNLNSWFIFTFSLHGSYHRIIAGKVRSSFFGAIVCSGSSIFRVSKKSFQKFETKIILESKNIFSFETFPLGFNSSILGASQLSDIVLCLDAFKSSSISGSTIKPFSGFWNYQVIFVKKIKSILNDFMTIRWKSKKSMKRYYTWLLFFRSSFEFSGLPGVVPISKSLLILFYYQISEYE